MVHPYEEGSGGSYRRAILGQSTRKHQSIFYPRQTKSSSYSQNTKKSHSVHLISNVQVTDFLIPGFVGLDDIGIFLTVAESDNSKNSTVCLEVLPALRIRATVRVVTAEQLLRLGLLLDLSVRRKRRQMIR